MYLQLDDHKFGGKKAVTALTLLYYHRREKTFCRNHVHMKGLKCLNYIKDNFALLSQCVAIILNPKLGILPLDP